MQRCIIVQQLIAVIIVPIGCAITHKQPSTSIQCLTSTYSEKVRCQIEQLSCRSTNPPTMHHQCTEKGGDPEAIRESQRRRFADVSLVDKVVDLDRQWRDGTRTHTDSPLDDYTATHPARFAFDRLGKQFNAINKQISELRRVVELLHIHNKVHTTHIPTGKAGHRSTAGGVQVGQSPAQRS